MKKEDNELKSLNIRPERMLLDAYQRYMEDENVCYHSCCNVAFYGEELDFDMQDLEFHEDIENKIQVA